MKRPSKGLQILLAVALLLYACGYVTQFIGNYAVWQKNGGMLGGTSPPKSMRWGSLDLRYLRPIRWVVSLFDAAGLPQRYFVVSVQPLLYGRLRSSSRCNCPVSKAVQPRCLN
jgi:hypothetical protein